jgi:hypothetical protein
VVATAIMPVRKQTGQSTGNFTAKMCAAYTRRYFGILQPATQETREGQIQNTFKCCGVVSSSEQTANKKSSQTITS